MTRDQIGIVTIGPGLALLAVLLIGWLMRAATLPFAHFAPPQTAALCALLIAITLIWAILEVSLGRFFSPRDIAGAGLTEASSFIQLRRAILQNTLEQIVLALIAYVGVAALAPTQIAVLPCCAAFLIAGRIAFRIGYPYGAPWRAPGFALTFAPTIYLYWVALSAALA